jgi:hypothetical protein
MQLTIRFDPLRPGHQRCTNDVGPDDVIGSALDNGASGVVQLGFCEAPEPQAALSRQER